MYLGIDCGTQSTKALLWSPDAGVIATSAVKYGLMQGLPAGHKEQAPATWSDAMHGCMAQLGATQDLGAVRAIGVSGQQHGAVFLDETGTSIRPAKLWCDTSTQAECEAIVAAAGGFDAYHAEIGNALPTGFTAGKICWLRQHEPSNYRRVASILLPHDWLNFQLTGCKTTDAGDASGTGYFDVRARRWSRRALGWIDPDRDLSDALPELVPAGESAGTLRAALAGAWGMRPDVVVSSGSGDNMMAALGAGAVTPGRVVMSLGTSGTVFACAAQAAVDPTGQIAAFCDASGGWLPLGCTLNVTVATEMVRRAFLHGADYDGFETAVASVAPGCDGLLLLPYLEGERLPDLPNGTGVYLGVRPATATPAHFARAAMEGATLGLNHALTHLLALLDGAPDELVLLGGGARSATWRQIVADITELPVVRPETEEGPALGAAIQAAWTHTRGDLAELCAQAVCFRDERNLPARSYAPHKELFANATGALRDSGFFSLHRGTLR
jgi:xylulokinase